MCVCRLWAGCEKARRAAALAIVDGVPDQPLPIVPARRDHAHAAVFFGAVVVQVLARIVCLVPAHVLHKENRALPPAALLAPGRIALALGIPGGLEVGGHVLLFGPFAPERPAAVPADAVVAGDNVVDVAAPAHAGRAVKASGVWARRGLRAVG